jgi:hypothetical protein
MLGRLHVPQKLKRAALLCMLTMFCFVCATTASADASNVSCDSLSATMSSDKNYYIFTAASSGDNTDISGYTFNFGDKQSYTITFAASSTQDRHSVTVTHAYQSAGNYTPTVQVNTKVGGKTSSTSSPNCRTSLVIQSASSTTLPNTGAHGTPQLFVATFLIGAGLYELRLRRRQV